ncbi:interleukin-15 isoform X7 [Rattus norvegicus]|uniref:interleukin-15 isoform X7 n=1 Tax=Rattus norvegicus TaxID=10116 RepID=UPI0019176ED9|nr:interleukin-15 isoform X5 [Rattus norvegicus]
MQATCELRPTPCETSQKAKAFQDTQQLRPTAQGVETALGLSVALQVLHPGDLAVAESCGHLLGLGLPGWKALGGSRGSPGLFGLFAPCASIAHAGFRPASCTFQPEPDGASPCRVGQLAGPPASFSPPSAPKGLQCISLPRCRDLSRARTWGSNACLAAPAQLQSWTKRGFCCSQG